MELKSYKRLQVNPLRNEWEETGKARLLEEEAKILNGKSNHTGVKYELVEEEFNINSAKKDELIAFAEQEGIDLEEGLTKAQIIEKIKEAQ